MAGRRSQLTARHASDLRPASGLSPVERFDALRLQAKVREALSRLSLRERELLLLRAEGYSYRDLAAVLELNQASVGTLLARAKRTFEKVYEEVEHAP